MKTSILLRQVTLTDNEKEIIERNETLKKIKENYEKEIKEFTAKIENLSSKTIGSESSTSFLATRYRHLSLFQGKESIRFSSLPFHPVV